MSAEFAVKPPQALFYPRPKVGKQRSFLIRQQIVDLNKTAFFSFSVKIPATVDLPEFIAPPILTIFITPLLLFPKIRTALSF